MTGFLQPDSLAYHAARVLLLVLLCGKPRAGADLPGIQGRTLLAKLDFFVRYPEYLQRASRMLGKETSREDLGLATDDELRSVESRMVRYLYGPWDHVYYQVLAYLIGKQLIAVEMRRGTEVFRLTPRGQETTERLAADPAYADLARRASTAGRLFNRYTGTGLKTFVYSHFPEVVNRRLGDVI